MISRGEIITQLKASLGDAVSGFKAADDADFQRHLDTALADFSTQRPRIGIGSFDLLTGQMADYPNCYAVPADFIQYRQMIWGAHCYMPWEPLYPGQLPRVARVDINDQQALTLTPAPTQLQLSVCGSRFSYHYLALHKVGTAAQTTVPSQDVPLLVLRCQAEAMRELAMRNINKPVAMRDGLTGSPRNSTPAALYQALLGEFWKAGRS